MRTKEFKRRVPYIFFPLGGVKEYYIPTVTALKSLCMGESDECDMSEQESRNVRFHLLCVLNSLGVPYLTCGNSLRITPKGILMLKDVKILH